MMILRKPQPRKGRIPPVTALLGVWGLAGLRGWLDGDGGARVKAMTVLTMQAAYERME